MLLQTEAILHHDVACSFPEPRKTSYGIRRDFIYCGFINVSKAVRGKSSLPLPK